MIALRTGKSNGRGRSRSKQRTGQRTRRAGIGSRNHSIRYAVVGLGYIAQAAVLPAFRHARNSKLAALVSGDSKKLKALGRKYGVDGLYSYDQYDELLRSGTIDAVYIAVPNSMHAKYTIRAADAGIHVLCEKPMAVTETECRQMIDACRRNNVKLMIAYRLHFEPANLGAVELVQSNKLGNVRLFDSIFTMNVKDGDIRLDRELGGGTLYDIGIYCINAARYLFRAEPVEVSAVSVSNSDPRFREVDEMTAAILRFPGDRLASFVTSFGSADVSQYRVVGTKGDLRVEPAYDYSKPLKHHLTLNGKMRQKTFSKHDQFAPELTYFSQCIMNGEDPEPSGEEGLIDVRIIEALYHSANIGQPVSLGGFPADRPPTRAQEFREPAVSEPRLVHAESPSDE